MYSYQNAADDELYYAEKKFDPTAPEQEQQESWYHLILYGYFTYLAEHPVVL